MVDLTLSHEHRQIADSVHAWLAYHAPLARLNGGAGPHADAELLRGMGDLGWLGLGVAEDKGGLGLGTAEDFIVASACGRALITPALVGTIVGARLAAAAGLDGLAAAMIAGEMPVGLALRRDRQGDRSDLPFLLVDALPGNPVCLWSPDAITLYPWSAIEETAPLPALDESLALAGAQVRTSEILAVSRNPIAIGNATVLGAALLTGIAERACEAAVEYAGTRQQFGRPIGSFQAVKHRCADMTVQASAARSMTLFAAVANDDRMDDAAGYASAAHLVASAAAIANAAGAVQVFGGIGYTDECEAHLFVKRAQVLARIFGDKRTHEQRLLGAAPA